MKRIPRKVATPLIAILLLAVSALSASHDFTHAQDGYIGGDEIVIDGVVYKRTETEFEKISPFPEEAVTPFIYDEGVYSGSSQQDPYPSLDGQTVSPTVICEDASQSKCTNIGTAQVVAIGDPVYGDFYKYTTLWQKISYKGINYYSPYDVLDPGHIQAEAMTPARKEAMDNNVITKNNNKKPDIPSPITIRKISEVVDSAVKQVGDWIFTKTVEYNRNRGTWVATPEQGIEQISKDMNDFYDTDYTAEQIAKINGVSDVNQIKTGSTFVIGTPDGWKPPKKTSNIDEEYWNNLTVEQQKILQYHRNFYQPIAELPPKKSEMVENEWSCTDEAIAHNIGTSGNIDCRGEESRTGQQAIFDAEGNLVTTPENMGTYDFEKPSINNVYYEHTMVDVAPWILYGNSPQDTTTMDERICAFSKDWKGKLALDFYLKYNYEHCQ